MKELNIKTAAFTMVRRFIGIIAILAAIAWLAGHWKGVRLFDILYFITFVLLGLVNLTDSFGQERTLLKNTGDGLFVKWVNRFRSISIRNDEIANITLARTEVMIGRKAGKNIKLSLDTFETAHKKEIYEFFIEFCNEGGIELQRRFERLNAED